MSGQRWRNLIGWFVDRPFIVGMGALLLVLAGVYVAPFDWDIGSVPRDPVPVDAIPDIGENQQIVFTEWMGRSPRDVEDQISYPLTTSLLGIPGVKTIRSSSAFGFSTIYIIFEDDIEFYWSRSRVLEKLASLPPGTVPDGVTPTLGPDATALGQVFWYTLEGRDRDGNVVGGFSQHELRSVQDWIVRYALQGVSGVSEVASIGGFVREYQVDVDPEAMRAHDVSLAEVANAVRQSNLDIGARTVEINRVEYIVRGLGFVEDVRELEEAVVAVRDNVPVRVREVARVALGPGLRRGYLDDAGAPAVGGVVVARFRENPLFVIHGVHERIAQIAPGLPQRTLEDGTVSQVTIVPFYDRTELILETLESLSHSLWDEILITILVILVLLRDIRTSFVVSGMLPLGVLAAFITMKLTGVDANIMALGGVAIAIGTMADVGIVFTENIYSRLERAAEGADPRETIKDAAAEVAPAVLTGTLMVVVSFLPVFGLASSEARLFSPLAATKSFAMMGALFLSIVLLPTIAYLVLGRSRKRAAAAPAATAGWRGLAARIDPRRHLREWIVLAGGIALCFASPLAGAIVIVLGLYQFVRPLVPEARLAQLRLVELALVVGAVTLVYSSSWQPLGPEPGWVLNTIFVAVIVTVVLGFFLLFGRAYGGLLRVFLRHKLAFAAIPLSFVALGAVAWLGTDTLLGWLPESVRESGPMRGLARAFPGLGAEYMPPFDEGAFLYMPTTLPHASIGTAEELLSDIDASIAQIPEVERVVGKLGRVESALDPAPISMFEAVITYKSEYRVEEDGSRVRQWRDHIRTPADIWTEIIAAARRPGLTTAPMLMPINARITMLQSGMRAPMGIKVQGPDLETIEQFGYRLEELLRQVPSIVPETVYADRVVGKPYLEIDIDRVAIARYGLTIDQVQHVLKVALGGMILTRTVEGRERYPVRVRYMREERDSLEAIEELSVPTPAGQQIPLSQLATIQYVRGPQVIKSEDTFLTSYVLFDRRQDVAEVNVVEEAQAFIQEQIDSGNLQVPAGVSYRFAGSYENQVRSERRLMILIPLAFASIFVLLYLQFRRVSVSLMIYSGVAVAISGAFLLMWLYGQPWFLDFDVLGMSMRTLFRVQTINVSVALWVGMIALVGVAGDNGVVLATYLQQRFAESPPDTIDGVRELAFEGGMRRVRPCLMVTAITFLALMPVITSQGKGSDVMVPMALPLMGGMAIQLVTLFVVPVLYSWAEERRLRAAPVVEDPEPEVAVREAAPEEPTDEEE